MLIKEFSSSVSSEIGQTMYSEGKKFDPITITLMILGILISLYKLCQPTHETINKPSFLQKWYFRRLIRKHLKSERDHEFGPYIYKGLLRRGSIMSRFEYDRYLTELKTIDLEQILRETKLG